MLTLAAITLILPAAYRVALGEEAGPGLVPLSVSISIVLLFVYALFPAFSLGTHSALFKGTQVAEPGHSEPWSISRAGLVLALSTVGIAWMSELLVHAGTAIAGAPA